MIRKTALTLLAVLATAPLLAQTNVGVVDFEAVIRESKRSQEAFASVETFRRERQAQLLSMAEAFQTKQAEAQAQAESLSNERARELTSELQRLQTELKRAKEDADREGQRLTNEALAKIDSELAPLVQQMAVEMQLHLVLQDRPDLGVVFVDSTIDITDEVIARFDALE